MPWGEREAVALLSEVLGAKSGIGTGTRRGHARRTGRGRRRGRAQMETGIGDDAAVIRVGDERLVWTIDDSEEGVHFDRRWLPLEDVGWRALHAAASDLAAMGATPVAALCHVTLPSAFSKSELKKLARGQAAAADSLRCPLVGGNLSRGNGLKVTTTVLGSVDEPVLRSGARPGDELWLLGDVGLARAGLRLLRGDAGTDVAPSRGRLGECVRRWRRPVALLEAGRALPGRATAAIDISDGLGGDAAHLSESSAVRIVIDEVRLGAALHPALGFAAERLGTSALGLAIAGGEDYALLATGPAKRRPRGAKGANGARVIGHVESGSGVVLKTAAGKLEPAPRGFDHLTD